MDPLLTGEPGRVGVVNGHVDVPGCREGTADADVEEMGGAYAGMGGVLPAGFVMMAGRQAGCV